RLLARRFERRRGGAGIAHEQARQSFARFGRNALGDQRRDALAKKPQAQVQRPAGQNHPREWIEMMPRPPQLRSEELPQLTERQPLIESDGHSGWLARANAARRLSATGFQMR